MKVENGKKWKYSNVNRIFRQHCIFNSLSSNHFSFESNISKFSWFAYSMHTEQCEILRARKICSLFLSSFGAIESENSGSFLTYSEKKLANRNDNDNNNRHASEFMSTLWARASNFKFIGFAVVVIVSDFVLIFLCAHQYLYTKNIINGENTVQNMQMQLQLAIFKKCIRRIKLNFVFMRVE